jgi:esterase/lipase superfamily enzyme
MVPTIRHLSGLANGFDQPILAFGASMGAMHAANLFFRRPDLFGGVFAISGLYESEDSFGDYMDDLLYQNTPCCYLPNMAHDHPYIDMYNNRKMLFVVGQGAWEDLLLASTRRLQSILESKGIHARFEYWGHDVDHDWPWWYKMVELYAPEFLY